MRNRGKRIKKDKLRDSEKEWREKLQKKEDTLKCKSNNNTM